MTFRILALCTGLVLCCALAAAEDTAAPWEPTTTDGMPEKWDWIQMTSNEWLKGKFTVMYDDNLEFDSDEFDLQSLDWDDIRRVRTGSILQVRLKDGTTRTGKLWVEGDDCKIIAEDGEHPFSREDVVSIAAGSPKEIDHWDGKITLGINVRSGNSDIREYNLTARFQRRTVKNRMILDYLGNYNITEGFEVANNHRATLNWDMFLTDRFYIRPVFFEYYADEFQNISHRETLGAGVGYQLIDTSKTMWQIDGGPAYQQTKFISVDEGDNPESTAALVAGTTFDTELTKWLDFYFLYRFQIVNDNAGRYNHHMVIDFQSEITKMLDFDIQWVWDRIENPRQDDTGDIPLNDDFRMIVGVTFEF